MGVPVGRTAVLVSALYLACSVAQPTFGKLSEELGSRRVFLTGIVLILIGGLIGGFAPNLMTLIISRVVIGIGTPEAAGLLIVPIGALTALVSRWVSGRNLIRWPLIAAGASMLAASLLTVLLDARSPAVLIIAVTLVFGVTMGTTTVGNQTALYTEALPSQVGTASGLFRTFCYVGSIASSTITGIVFRTSVTDGGLHLVAWILVGVSFLVLVMTVADRRLPPAARLPAGRNGSRALLSYGR
jgi:predicted MFS family arabinose efflux permease